ncbi:hypothetical protein HMPREF9075_00028 [Capnocytophaga sp. oral taxon 332 str. F0381]|uniref:hypothetical protein n=1 Tax=Capnocytophaga sp. oral taxon 332 TaxID=712213 RepID=UPI0002A3BB79|nr:hypothetical protein [Capnocytophaga sp. oral taxon 332]EKY13328.1 hypothetical protein HMPREF9075_00028 [Capnocytophaga sp. oral taxon 332 str. F0381]
MEEQVAQTLLEEPTTVTIGGEAYQVAPPSIFTLVRASKYISKIPTDTISEGNILGSIIHNAEEYENIAWAISVILLGKDFTQIVTYPKWQFWRKKKNVTKGELLAKKLINTPITEVSAAFFKVLGQIDIRAFFVITTSLKGMMITKPTKEVENQTTASGDL